ncbi:MAG: antA/AntB antirepressor family protein [Synergistaceae bacterium]|nr:antA/AntB antirepressor family protein [Synergistaceae bacterium]
MNIYYDGICRYCVDARELYEELSVWTMTEMSFQKWFKYMIDSGFDFCVDYVERIDGKGYLLTIDAAKKFCRITAFKIANEHNCFNEIFLTCLVQDVIDANVHNFQAKETKDYVENLKNVTKDYFGVKNHEKRHSNI